jgi:HEPN domain-containing protein
MDEAKRDYIRLWLDRACVDLQSARRLASPPEPILDTAFFHCQQAAEKAVKGYLAYQDHPLVKTHDVEELVELAESYEPRFATWREAAAKLTPYATAFRYPPKARNPDEEQYQQAEQAAAGLFAFVCSLLPPEAQPPEVTRTPANSSSESKLDTIYVYLPDEGVDVWRPVLAERLGESVFRITVQEYDRSIERWEFAPGDVVYCEPTQLSEGLYLVAKRRA